jgi:hypothetical protein
MAISSLSPDSLYWQMMAMWKASQHHGFFQDPQATIHSRIVRLLIMIVGVRQVASKVKDGEAVVRAMGAAINSTIDGIFNYMPGDDATNQVPPGWIFHHGPNPYLVASELIQYANTLTDESARAEYTALIGTIAGRITQALAS